MSAATSTSVLLQQERSCGWCGEAPWAFSCATCDPRREKRVCAACAWRWHSRGAGGAHMLTSRAGRAQPYSAWSAEAQARVAATNAGGRQQQQQQQEEDGQQIIVDSPDATDATNGGTDDDTEEEATAAEAAAAVTATTSSSATQEEEEEEEEAEEMLMPLNDLLALLPSDDLRLLDALSEYIHAALRVQDGLACVRFGKCARPECVRIVEVARHNASNEPPCDADCRLGLEMYQHIAACTQQGCPFCIRVRLRKELNSIRAIESLVAKQRAVMKRLVQAHKDGASDAKANFNFCVTQVKEYERKRLQLVEHVEEMNALVLRLRLPIFNFPQPSWHIGTDPPIKTETISSPPRADANGSNSQQELPAQPASEEEERCGEDETAPTSDGDDLANVDAADYIRVLLAKKQHDAQAQRKFDEAIDLANAIVEASFCSPSKAPRCLLHCQRILDHLQHHLDLSVCDDIMCTTVEYHFAHLSICAEESENEECEYCLRVKERELMRAQNMMEGELREAEAKAQAVIDEIAVSFANDTRKEHEAVFGQLEDELEQAEEYKRDMTRKLSASRRSLRGIREQMESLSIPTSVLKILPQHFTKVAKKESSTKRRKW